MNVRFNRKFMRLIAAVAIGLAVWTLRVAVVGDLGTGIPFWDQWDREGLVIYAPLLEGKLSWRAIFEPHLEHRIVWTHLWNIALLKLCGQWDPMVQMVAQAIFPAVTAGVCVWGLLRSRSDWIWRCAVVTGGLLAFGSPLADGNILWGFQSQFGLLIALSIGLCASAGLAWRKSVFCWVVLPIGLAAPFAMGAGALSGPTIIVMSAVVICAERKLTRRSGAMLAIGLICFLWGMGWRSHSTIMEFARAGSVSTFLLVWFRTLAWPNCWIPSLAAVACLPVAGLTIQMVRRRGLPSSRELFIVGIAVWAIGCAAGGAWTRGGVDPVPPSRYYDFLAILCWANFLAVVLLAGVWWKEAGARGRTAGIFVAVAWMGVTFFGGTKLMDDFFRVRRPVIRATVERQFEGVNGVLAGAPVAVMSSAGLHPSPEILQKVMGSPVLGPFLPPELQQPLPGSSPQGNLAVALPGPHGNWSWQSGEFENRMSAMIVFVRGEADGVQLSSLNPATGATSRFQPTGRRIGSWAEWLGPSPRGQQRFRVELDAGPGEVAIMFPRPISAVGYWARREAAQWRWLCGLAGLSLGVALLAACSESGKAESEE